MRQKMSRPCWSVPNQCSTLGGRKDAERFWAYGSYGRICGAIAVTIAMSARKQMTPKLTMAGTF